MAMSEMLLELPDEAATAALARRVATGLGRDTTSGLVIWLQGQLGAGKTVFARHFLQALGVDGRVKSPTYSLVEPYRLGDGRSAWHLDLYRIADPSELEWLGLDELGDSAAVVLVEWPERGQGALPACDLHLELVRHGDGRMARVRATSGRGRRLLSAIEVAAPG